MLAREREKAEARAVGSSGQRHLSAAPYNLELNPLELSCSLGCTLPPRYLVGGEGAHVGQ